MGFINKNNEQAMPGEGKNSKEILLYKPLL